MSDKTFLQELESIRNKVQFLCDEYEIDGDAEKQLLEIREDLQRMITQCIEIQLKMMKQERTPLIYDRDK